MSNKARRLVRWAKVVGVETWQQADRAHLFMVASGLAYTTILSIVPVLAVSFSLFHAFGGMERAMDLLEPLILENLAHGSGAEAQKILHGFIANAHAGAVGVSGFVALMFTTITMLSSCEKAINRVWGIALERKFFQRLTAYWFFISVGPLVLSAVLGLMANAASTSAQTPGSLVSSFSRYIPSGTGMFLILGVFFMAIFKYVPHRKVNWQPALIAGFVNAIAWLVARVGYSFYVAHFVSHNKVYGSFAAVPIILFWIYVLWLILLFGAAFAAVLQKRWDEILP